MASSSAKTVAQYIHELPENKREIIIALRDLMRESLPEGFVETMNWGMICYEVPLETYPKTYNKKPLMHMALAAQKQYNSLYLMSVYSDKNIMDQLESGFNEAGLKLNMGKSCIRFKTLEDLPLETIKSIISKTSLADFIAFYEKSREK
jgi:hypothetical protein